MECCIDDRAENIGQCLFVVLAVFPFLNDVKQGGGGGSQPLDAMREVLGQTPY